MQDYNVSILINLELFVKLLFIVILFFYLLELTDILFFLLILRYSNLDYLNIIMILNKINSCQYKWEFIY